MRKQGHRRRLVSKLRRNALSCAGFEMLENRLLLSVGLVADINQIDVQPSDLTPAGSMIYFTATDPSTGKNALWTTNPASNVTTMIADYPASQTSPLAALGSSVYFIAADGGADGADALYSSDGEGKGIVKDVTLPGKVQTPLTITTTSGLMYFLVQNQQSYVTQIFESDGTQSGTVAVPGAPDSSSGVISSLIGAGSHLYFLFESSSTFMSQLWASDGTSSGTLELASGNGGSFIGLQQVGSELGFFTTSVGLGVWLSDGTPQTTQEVDLGPGGSIEANSPLAIVNGSLFFVSGTSGLDDISLNSGATVQDLVPSTVNSFANFTMLGGDLLFTASDSAHGNELWSTNGTVQGTALLKDIDPGPASGFPQGSIYTSYKTPDAITTVNGLAYLTADDGIHGQELWRTDGTTANTVMVMDINPGSSSSSPQDIVALGDVVYFVAHDGDGSNQLWSSGPGGTVLVHSFLPLENQGSYPTNLTPGPNGLLFFVANDGVDGDQLFFTNGTTAGTTALFTSGNIGGSITFVSLGDVLLFIENEPNVSSSNLYATDGTVGGTRSILSGQNIVGLFKAGQLAYFLTVAPNAPQNGTYLDLWRTDGTTQNSVNLGLVDEPNTVGAYFPHTVDAGGHFYFEVFTASFGHVVESGGDLWTSDPSNGAPIQLAASYSGAGFTNLTAFENKVLFTSEDSSAAGESLWISNGTASGTTVIKDFTGAAYSSPSSLSNFTTIGSSVYFTVFEPGGREQLWVTDGTTNGTVLLHDFPGIAAGQYPGGITALTASNGKLFFVVTDPSSNADHDSQLWVSDGTSMGTTSINDFGSSPYLATGLTDVNGVLDFIAIDPAVSTRSDFVEAIWKSDGTSSGTIVVADLPSGNSGQNSSNPVTPPSNFIAVSGSFFFTAPVYDSATQTSVESLWESQGTSATTEVVGTGFPASFSATFVASLGSLYFTGTDDRGSELWAANGLNLQQNILPTIDPIPNQPVGVGQTFTLPVSGSAPDNDPFTWSLASGPQGATIDPSSGVLTWAVPANESTGPYSVTVVLTDSITGLSADQVVSISVYTPPTLNAIASQTLDVGSTLSLTASGSTTDAGVLTFSLVNNAQVGAAIDPNTGELTWQIPSNQPGGTYSLMVLATDTLSLLSASQTFSVLVYAPPTIGSIPDQDITLGEPFIVNIPATTGDSGPLAFSLVAGSPAGASVNPSNGAFEFTPTALGVYTITVQVTDKLTGLSSSQSFSLNVVQAPTGQTPVFIGAEELLSLGRGKKEHLKGFEIAFAADLDSTAEKALRYSITQLMQKGRWLKPVKVNFTTRYNSSGRFVDLLVAGRPKFLHGGQIVITSPSNALSLHGSSVFAIPKKA